MITQIAKESDAPPNGQLFEDTTVHVESVIAYWSRTIKTAVKTYSPIVCEALALKKGLEKHQGHLEGKSVITITDSAALT